MRPATLILALVATSLAGCIHFGNHAPVAKLTASVTSGDSPLNVTFSEQASDEDGDFLTVTLGGDSRFDPTSYAEIPKGTAVTPVTLHDTWIIYINGFYNVTLRVSDGEFTATDSVTLHVTGETYLPSLLKAVSNVTQPCTRCSGGVPPYVGTVASTGAMGCTGFLTGQNGTDCVWYNLRPEWDGHTFFANATDDADADVEMRTDCTTGPQATDHYYIHQGLERDRIPSGAGCAVLWTYYKAPASIRFQIYK
jgi:hypothetical protein